MSLPRTVSVDAVDVCLPQTQCTRCGYPRCRDYAVAVVNGESTLNRCPPGGVETIERLAVVLQKPIVPLAAELGQHEAPRLTRIREQDCIGCTLCIQACPVDAIVGGAKLMHTVLVNDCTGCELCIPVCPMDCIDLVSDFRNVPATSPWKWFDPIRVENARSQTINRLTRLRQKQNQRVTHGTPDESERQEMRDEIKAAVERTRHKRAATAEKSQRVDVTFTPATTSRK